MGEEDTGTNQLELAADIVSAYVSKNPVPAASLPEHPDGSSFAWGSRAGAPAIVEERKEPVT
jgi:predicted transcriptional regulator